VKSLSFFFSFYLLPLPRLSEVRGGVVLSR
jgi:hypothetical protein